MKPCPWCGELMNVPGDWLFGQWYHPVCGKTVWVLSQRVAWAKSWPDWL